MGCLIDAAPPPTQVLRREHKLTSYTLNSVSENFLGDRKDDVHHSQISVLHRGSAADRSRLATYCLKDSILPQRLISRLFLLVNLVEMARVCGVPISWLLTRGQSCKVYSQILRAAKARRLVAPTLQKQKSEDDGVAYVGATVLEPIAGFYDQCVATLDFASLYPSIMRRHNLCYTTMIAKGEHAKYPPEKLTRTPLGDYFVTADVFPGLLPEILTKLTAERKKAKAELKTEKDPGMRAVLDGRQLALKVSSNSVYGFTGALVGPLPALEISAGTTSFGREMIEASKKEAESTFPRAKVVYGDTDSIMVLLQTKDVAEALKTGKRMAVHITEKLFKAPVSLEFEKVYWPFLLLGASSPTTYA